MLGSRYIMYGEWMFAKHTAFYDALPHYFMEFDVLDTEKNVFLSTSARNMLLPRSIVEPVLVLAEGKFDRLDDLKKHIKRSNFITDSRLENLRTAAMNAGVSPIDAINHTDMSEDMEGLYIKWEDDGIVKGRYKFVRETFTNKIMDSEEHWHDRPIVQNMLIPGGFDKMFGC